MKYLEIETHSTDLCSEPCPGCWTSGAMISGMAPPLLSLTPVSAPQVLSHMHLHLLLLFLGKDEHEHLLYWVIIDSILICLGEKTNPKFKMPWHFSNENFFTLYT